MRDSKVSAISVGIIIAHYAGRLEQELDELRFGKNKDMIAPVFDEIIDKQLAHGCVSESKSVIKNCLTYLKTHGLNKDKSKILRDMKHADVVFIDVLNMSDKKDQEALICGMKAAKFDNVIRELYKSQYACRVESALHKTGKSVYDLERDQIAPIVNIFNACKNGISTYVHDDLMLADLFTQYLRLEIVRPELAFKQFFWTHGLGQPLKSDAQIIERVPSRVLVRAITQMKNYGDQGFWLSFCTSGVWHSYIEWLINNHKAECYSIAEQVALAAKNDELVRVLQSKFNDH